MIIVLFDGAGEHLRAHLEYCLVQLLKRLGDEARITPEQREVMLQALIHMAAAPFFLIDLYVNYDSELHGSNLCDDLVRFLAMNAAGCPLEALLALSAPPADAGTTAAATASTSASRSPGRSAAAASRVAPAAVNSPMAIAQANRWIRIDGHQ